MKATYRAMEGRIAFEIEGTNAKEVFAQIAEVQDVFDAEHQCGLCGSKDIRFSVREAEGKKAGKAQVYTYYELRCQGILQGGDPCRARFDFGQSIDTLNLFPKRAKPDSEGNAQPMPDRGWYRYVPDRMRQENRNSEPPGDTREPEPRRQTTQPRPEPFEFSSLKTPTGMQPSFDRLGDLVKGIKATPTTLPGALAALDEALRKHAGDQGREKFRQHVEIYKASPDLGSAHGAKVLLRDLVVALDAVGGTAAA